MGVTLHTVTWSWTMSQLLRPPWGANSSLCFVWKQVKALNTKGNSEYSNEIATTTKVSKIPPPLHVTFDPNSRVLAINVGATCLSVIAIVESVVNVDTLQPAWQIVDTIHLQVSGNAPTYKETVIEHLVLPRRSTSGRSLGTQGDDDLSLALSDENQPKVRVKLCLRQNHEHCGEYTEAKSKLWGISSN